jgi:hypothetical protein
MTASTMMQTTRGNGDCGCAGSGIKSAAPCTCGGKGCSTCQGDVYARPQFFAGQLLTEDDLQSLGDYVVAKNRLHMRYLVGSGVVCGLAVTCEPCGDGKVIVNPGYALDCCGNDIVVPCPQTLDINGMIRDLLLRVRGQDCGDPCLDAKPSPQGEQSTNARATTIKNPSRRYCLYIDYCERPSDPVAPYAVGDPCGQLTCEPTRIREGFRFELGCPVDDDCVPEICQRFWACVGEPTAAERTFVEAGFLCRYAYRLRAATHEIREKSWPAISSEYWPQLKDDVDRLTKALETKEEENGLRRVLAATLKLAGKVARFWVQNEPRLNGEHRGLLLDAMRELASVHTRVSTEELDRAVPTTLERAHAASLLNAIAELAPSRIEPRAGEVAESLERIADERILYLAHNAVVGRPIFVAATDSLAAMRSWLIEHLDRAGNTHCTLLKKVCTAPAPICHADSVQPEAQAISSTAEAFSCAVREVLKDCICNALIPTCSSCDDTRVLLACLTVEDCAVIDICNLERKFVVTGANLRYWIPELGQLGEALEEWCCEPCCYEPCCGECGDEDEWNAKGESRSVLRQVFGSVPREVEVALSAILGGCPPPRYGAKKIRRPTPLLEAFTKLGERDVRRPETGTVSNLVDQMKAEFEEKIAALREEIASLRADQDARRSPGGPRDRGGRR